MKTFKNSLKLTILLFSALFAINCFAEELKIDIAPSLGKANKNGNQKQEIAPPQNLQLQKRYPIAKPEEEIAIKPEETEGKVTTKKIFRPEVGIIEIVAPTGGDYGTLSLQDCINIAVKNHLPLQIAEKNVALGKMRLWEARRNMLPSVAIDYQEYTGRVYGRAYVGRKQYIEGQQPIFHGGELYFLMKQAEVNLEIVKIDADRIRNEIVLQVKKGYYTLAKARGNLRAQKELAAEVDRVFDMVKKEYESNVAAKLEFLNVSSQVSQVRYQLASAEGDEEVADLILRQAMNIDLKGKFNIDEGLDFKKVDVDFEKALDAAFTHRAEIKINSLMLDYYNYGKKIATAKLWPKIDIMGNWGLAKEEYASPDLGTDKDEKLGQQWYAGIKASMPFWGSTAEYSWTKEQWVPVVSAFQGTETTTSEIKFKFLDHLDYYSDRQLSDIDFDNQRQQMLKIKQDMTLELKESCFSYEKALIQLETASSKVKYQEGDLDLTKLRRGLDEAQDSNVIDSMIKLAQEKFGYLQALADCHISLASINKAIGAEDYFKDERGKK